MSWSLYLGIQVKYAINELSLAPDIIFYCRKCASGQLFGKFFSESNSVLQTSVYYSDSERRVFSNRILLRRQKCVQ